MRWLVLSVVLCSPASAQIMMIDPPAKPPEPVAVYQDGQLFVGGPYARSIWGRCWITISTKNGDVRIQGEDKQPCVDAFDRAVRMARGEVRVNGKPRR